MIIPPDDRGEWTCSSSPDRAALLIHPTFLIHTDIVIRLLFDMADSAV